MVDKLMRCGFPIAFSAVMSAGHGVKADDPLVFISSFGAGEKGAIHAFQLDLAIGQLKQTHKTTDVEHPFFLAVSPNHKYLYSTHAKRSDRKEHEHVAAYEIVSATGQLRLLNRQSSLGTAVCYLDVDATGQTVLVANYTTGSVASLPVREDGSLGEAATFVQHKGSSVDRSRQEGPHAHCIVVSPDSQFVYVADLGLDQVLSYRLDGKTSQLSPNRPPFVQVLPGAGPRHLTFHPNGKHVYVINELSDSITMLDYESKTGRLTARQTLSTLPQDFDGTKNHCADLKITPDGQFLYGTNRGHDSIAAYKIGAGGRLTLLGIEASRGAGPQNLAIAPGGKLLLCANMAGNNVVVFRINPTTGGLESVGEPIEITSPSCMLFHSL